MRKEEYKEEERRRREEDVDSAEQGRRQSERVCHIKEGEKNSLWQAKCDERKKLPPDCWDTVANNSSAQRYKGLVSAGKEERYIY